MCALETQFIIIHPSKQVVHAWALLLALLARIHAKLDAINRNVIIIVDGSSERE